MATSWPTNDKNIATYKEGILLINEDLYNKKGKIWLEIVENTMSIRDAAIPVESEIIGLKHEEKPAISRKVLREIL